MPQRYDATVKRLVERHPADWLAFAGLPAGTAVTVEEADVSAVTAAADKVLRVEGPAPYIAHLEFQSGPDADLDRRVLLYNVLLRWRHGLPVRSVVLLLHPRAQARGVRGRVDDLSDDPQARLEFAYRLIRVWENPADTFLSGGLGTLALAPIAAIGAGGLSEVFRRMDERLDRDASAPVADELWTAAYIMSGLRHDPEVVRRMMKGVRHMRDSATFQAILEEGEANGARAALLLVGKRRFGPPSHEALLLLKRIRNPRRMEGLVDRVLTVSSWDELLAGQEPDPPDPWDDDYDDTQPTAPAP